MCIYERSGTKYHLPSSPSSHSHTTKSSPAACLILRAFRCRELWKLALGVSFFPFPFLLSTLRKKYRRNRSSLTSPMFCFRSFFYSTPPPTKKNYTFYFVSAIVLMRYLIIFFVYKPFLQYWSGCLRLYVGRLKSDGRTKVFSAVSFLYRTKGVFERSKEQHQSACLFIWVFCSLPSTGGLLILYLSVYLLTSFPFYRFSISFGCTVGN